jgi:hypothetical protein
LLGVLRPWEEGGHREVVRAGLTLRLESVDEVFRALLVLGGAHPAGGVARSFSSLLLSLRTRERA